VKTLSYQQLDDGIHCYISYYPFEEQKEFHDDRYHVRHRAVFSGTGGGKTYCGVDEVLGILFQNPKSVGYIFEPTYKMVRRILIPTLERKEFFGKPIESNPTVNAYKRGDGCIELMDDQTLWFGGVEEPEYAEGANVDVIMLDEAQYMSHLDETHDITLRRLRGSGRVDHDITQSIVTTTPPPLLPGERLYDFFENPETRNKDSKVYRWSMLVNPFTTEKYKQEIVATHHGSLGKRFVEGLFAPAGTGSFDYDSTIHEVVIENGYILRKHDKLPLIKVEDLVYFNKGVDFGWTNPSAALLIGYDGDDRSYILDEFYQNRTQTETLIEEIKEMGHNECQVVCDSSQPQTIDVFCKAGLVASGNKSKREDGIAELGGRFHVQGDKKPRIYVSSRCTHWINEVMVYNAEVKENDHAIDATRYAVMSRVGISGLDVSFSKVKL